MLLDAQLSGIELWGKVTVTIEELLALVIQNLSKVVVVEYYSFTYMEKSFFLVCAKLNPHCCMKIAEDSWARRSHGTRIETERSDLPPPLRLLTLL